MNLGELVAKFKDECDAEIKKERRENEIWREEEKIFEQKTIY